MFVVQTYGPDEESGYGYWWVDLTVATEDRQAAVAAFKAAAEEYYPGVRLVQRESDRDVMLREYWPC